jgi:IclR family transcriptional regulator, KDG regulon repressor
MTRRPTQRRSRPASAKAGAKGQSQRDHVRRTIKPVTAADRAARMLFAFAQSQDFLSLGEAARRARLSKPTAFRILTTLVAEGLLFQNEANAAYGLGFLPLRFADVVLAGITFRDQARTAMRRIRDAVNETVVLGIRDRHCYYNVDSLEGTHLIGQAPLIGVPIPCDVGAPGKALLAGMPDKEFAGYLRSLRIAATRMQKLRRERALVGRDGYAISSEDLLGGHTIATAVFDNRGTAIATLHVSFPQSRYLKVLERQCIKALIENASTISASLSSGAASP